MRTRTRWRSTSVSLVDKVHKRKLASLSANARLSSALSCPKIRSSCPLRLVDKISAVPTPTPIADPNDGCPHDLSDICSIYFIPRWLNRCGRQIGHVRLRDLVFAHRARMSTATTSKTSPCLMETQQSGCFVNRVIRLTSCQDEATVAEICPRD